MRKILLIGELIVVNKKTDNNDEFIEQKEQFTIKFEGENEISLSTLTSTLSSFDNLTKIAAKDRFKYEYKIKAFRKGSFEIELSSIALIVSNLLTPDNVKFVKECISTVKEWIEIKKHLKGKPPYKTEREDDKVKITNVSGESFLTSTDGAEILNNSQINANLIIIGSYLSGGSRKGFSIEDKEGKNILNIADNEYDYISSDAEIAPKKILNKQTIRTTLVVYKPDLSGNSKWELFYNVRINAKIEDDHWKKQIENHAVSFTRGTQIEVDLRIEVPLDDNNMPIDNKTEYFIEKVYRIIQPEITEKTQTKLLT